MSCHIVKIPSVLGLHVSLIFWYNDGQDINAILPPDCTDFTAILARVSTVFSLYQN